MTDTTLNRFLSSGTHAQRLAFTPTQATPASGPSPTAFWFETDTGNAFAWNFGTSAWVALPTGGGGGGGSSAFKGYTPGINAVSAPGLDLWHGFLIIMDEACTIVSLKFAATAASATTTMQAAIYADNGMKVDGGALLANSGIVTGVTLGINTLTLTTPLVVTAGQLVWAGFINHVASANFAASVVPNGTFFNAPVGAPPNPAGTSSIGANAAVWLSK